MQTEIEALRSELVVVTERLARVTQEKDDALHIASLHPEQMSERLARVTEERNVAYEQKVMLHDSLARVTQERDEAWKRVGEADAQRMVALRKNEARVSELEVAEDALARLKTAVQEIAVLETERTTPEVRTIVYAALEAVADHE